MSKYRPPHPDAVQGLPHGAERHTRQPYAAELDDYAGGLLKAPESKRALLPANRSPKSRGALRPGYAAPRWTWRPSWVSSTIFLTNAMTAEGIDLESLRREAASCRACPLWRNATQTVFGEGPSDAELMLVGEQPGDRKDLSGRPFERGERRSIAAGGRRFRDCRACRSAYLASAMNVVTRRKAPPRSAAGPEDLFGRRPGAGGLSLRDGPPDARGRGRPRARLAALPFKPFDFHGYQANRQVVGFGFRYDYGARQVVEAPPLPSFLDPLRQKIAAAFDRPAEAFEQVLINEYRPGAGIGWHRDKAQFDEVVGVSLLAPCTFRFRRKSGNAWDRISLAVEPRSAYLLSGPSRTVWEHSIPALDRHRYSITFRTLAATRR